MTEKRFPVLDDVLLAFQGPALTPTSEVGVTRVDDLVVVGTLFTDGHLDLTRCVSLDVEEARNLMAVLAVYVAEAEWSA